MVGAGKPAGTWSSSRSWAPPSGSPNPKTSSSIDFWVWFLGQVIVAWVGVGV